MQLQAGMVVRAIAGKEKNGFYVIVRIDEGAVYLADGRHRTLEKPKRKNVKHIRATEYVMDLENMTNRALYRRLQERYAQQGG